MQKLGYLVVFGASALLGLTGCATYRVAVLTPSQEGANASAGDVQVVSSFRDIKEPWSVAGMACVASRSSTKAREDVLKSTVSGLGANTLVAVQSDIAPIYKGAYYSIGIVAKRGAAGTAGARAVPGFIACMLPVKVKVKTPVAAEVLEKYVRDYLWTSLSESKGYYVYRCPTQGTDAPDIFRGDANPRALGEPIGIAPDYVVLAEVEGIDAGGTVVFENPNDLKFTVTLYDLANRKIAWKESSAGRILQQRRVAVYAGSSAAYALNVAVNRAEDQANPIYVVHPTVRAGLDKILAEIPALKGWRGPEN
jgi:hypothetical protein